MFLLKLSSVAVRTADLWEPPGHHAAFVYALDHQTLPVSMGMRLAVGSSATLPLDSLQLGLEL